MRLDAGTVFVTCFAGCATLGVLMLLAWFQNREARALAWWGAAYMVGACGLVLLALRGEIAPFLSIDLGNALALGSLGLLWSGVRRFDSRPLPLAMVLGAVIVWLIACRIPAFYEAAAARAALYSLIAAALSLATAADLWRGRSERLASRAPATVICAINGAANLLRIYFADTAAFPEALSRAQPAFSLLMLESMLFALASAFTLVALTKERAEVAQRTAAAVDALTGVYNRRAFFERAERLLQRSAMDGKPVAVMVFDLDHFKQINDRFGHPTGDKLLIEFAEIAVARLRGNDLFGRIGGEEFAAILPGASQTSAFAAAERIRKGFAATEVGARRASTTVSVGVSALPVAVPDLGRLIASADRALYTAKAAGRDTVAFDTPTGMISTGEAPGEPVAARQAAADAVVVHTRGRAIDLEGGHRGAHAREEPDAGVHGRAVHVVVGKVSDRRARSNNGA